MEEMKQTINRVLSEEEVEKINEVLSSEEPLKVPDYEPEEGEHKLMDVATDPNTGEQIVMGKHEGALGGHDDFDEMVRKIDSGEVSVELDESPIKEDELRTAIATDNNFHADKDNLNISDESLQVLLQIANRRMKKEQFNVYRELPDDVKKNVDNMIKQFGLASGNAITNQGRALRNNIAESLIDEFIGNIQISRAQSDFNKELENIFKEGSKEISEEAIEYTEDRNKKYREYAETMEDEEKKQKLLSVLDVIDSAYNLDSLKEYAKTCKIKAYDIEDPTRYFKSFLNKYKDSTYNIYDIKLTLPILERRLKPEGIDDAQVIALLVCFCKYTQNYSVSNVYEHPFMYYFIYNIILIDTNTSEKTKHVSDKFVENLIEVINNLKERNPKLA